MRDCAARVKLIRPKPKWVISVGFAAPLTCPLFGTSRIHLRSATCLSVVGISCELGKSLFGAAFKHCCTLSLGDLARGREACRACSLLARSSARRHSPRKR